MLAWSPSGQAARAADAAASGDVAEALASLVAALIVVGVLGWWWTAGLDRSLTTAPPPAGARRGRRAPELFARPWACLPRDRRGAVAAKELRYWGLASINQYGYEGGAHWMNVVAGTDVRADLSGKNFALAAWVLAMVAAVAVALAAVSGGWVWVPVAVAVTVAVVWWPPGLALVVPLVLAWGFLCWRMGLAHAVRWLAPRQTELLTTLSPRRTG